MTDQTLSTGSPTPGLFNLLAAVATRHNNPARDGGFANRHPRFTPCPGEALGRSNFNTNAHCQLAVPIKNRFDQAAILRSGFVPQSYQEHS